MTVPVGFETNLLSGLAVYIAAATSTVGATYNASGIYTALQTGLVIGNIPQSPDRIITLDVYGADDDPSLSNSVIFMQVRCRAEGQDKRKVNDLEASIFNLIHGITALLLTTGVYVVQCPRNSGPLPLGQDTSGRWSVSSNYYVSVWRPSTHRT